ncbi:SDR family NAD(P)-dependent oxidoreductase [Algihabitans albus]|uniref:SDR family NAD(P)-dependent oxidoreductase n=1 Tax=Algihabitans albus TaxID=2164067 RepID=UPI001ABC5DE4|nr:SDR family NAD(P)-dependent oxidoreductase [Algihabitans albus]
MTDLQGKVALVTGGGTGIGKGIAERFHGLGMKVVLAGLDQAQDTANQYFGRNMGGYTAARQLADSLGDGAIALDTDVTDAGQVAAMTAATVESFGRIDVLVNGAGVITAKPVEDLSEADWDSVVGVNAKGTFLTNQAVVAQMRKQGGGGCIVNIASIAGKLGVPYLSHYCASKWAVIGFSISLAKEVAKEGITVNCLCPGIVGTQMWTLLSKAFAQPGEKEEVAYARSIETFIPQGVPQTEDDMADMTAFLITAPHITGQAFAVDGGASH